MTFPLRQFISSLYNQRQAIAVGLFTILIIALLAFSNIPAQQVFEGNFLVEELSFTYPSEATEDALFINAIRGLQQIELTGERTVIFTGQLSVTDTTNEKLNQAIADKRIDVKLLDDYSKLILQSTAEQLGLQELTLAPQTDIEQFTYHPRNNQLALAIASPDQPSALTLSLGVDPIRVILEGACFTPCDPANANTQNYLEFTWTPDVSAFPLAIRQSSELFLTLPPLERVNTQDWIAGDLAVSDVHFSRYIATASDDGWETSTILDGMIRMGDRTLALTPHQFLIQGEPGIETVHQLQIQAKTELSKPGLKVRFSGQSQQVQVGVDQKLPVQTLDVKLLDKHLSRDTISALFSFCGAVLGYLLSWLFTQQD